uniref:Putative secreted peptide n=1 Tax=Anopheles braziliensis TaxID=58242 RepID=A0A2M3ZRZ7_9DIPT
MMNKTIYAAADLGTTATQLLVLLVLLLHASNCCFLLYTHRYHIDAPPLEEQAHYTPNIEVPISILSICKPFPFL